MQQLFITAVVVLYGLLNILTTEASISVVTLFSQRNISGNITFSQSTPSSPTIISISLFGLDQFVNETYPWHVHEYPFTSALSSPCSSSNVGGHYDPLGANNGISYNCASDMSLCEIGDLSGKFGPLNSTTTTLSLTDNSLSLYGQYSIIGRSVVIHRSDGSRYVCANIPYPDNGEMIINYVPLRGTSIIGNIYLQQYSSNGTSVYAKLLISVRFSMDHNWHVHEQPIQASVCTSAAGHYNPRAVNTSNPNYATLCNGNNPLQCEVGDLSEKGGKLDFNEYREQLLYTDTDLPISLNNDISIANRSIVIHDANMSSTRIACGNLIPIKPRKATATFSGEGGVIGTIKFIQTSRFSHTKVLVKLTGLQGLADGYHVHETPVGKGIVGSERCLSKYTGGHWNPRNVTYSSAVPVTSDHYEVGDLSGKFGSLSNMMALDEEYADMNLPLYGTDSIIGRSIVIHFLNSSRWVCADILYDMPVIQATAVLSLFDYMIEFSFIQLADDPFADTTIIISELVQNNVSFPVTSSPSPSPTPSPESMGSGEDPMEPMQLRRRELSDVYIESDDLLLPHEYFDLDTPNIVENIEDVEILHLQKRESMATIKWSIRAISSGQQQSDDCNSLAEFLASPEELSTLCDSGEQLACSSGDLTSKHPMLQINPDTGIRMVLTDPYLPLSGPQSAIDNVLLVQSDDCPELNQYASISEGDSLTQLDTTSCTVTPTTTSSSYSPTMTVSSSSTSVSSFYTSSLPTSSTESGSALPLDLPYLIAVCVGGFLLAVILCVLLALIILCCVKKRTKNKFSMSYETKKSNIELGMFKRKNPVFGVATYKVLYSYKPQQKDDLELIEGELVALIEAPVGGDWWRGRVRDKEGWFPKTYVDYFDIHEEEKKKKEEDLETAAAAIRAASFAFTLDRGGLGTPSSTKKNILSTPVLAVSKFDHVEKETNFMNITSTPDLNQDCLNTPLIDDKVDTPVVTEALSSTSGNDSPLPNDEIYIAKFDCVGQSESELQLTKGDKVIIIEQADNGWWHGVIGDRHGWVPESFLESIDENTQKNIEEKDNLNDEIEEFRPRGMTEFHSGTSEEVEASEYKAITSFSSEREGDLSFDEGDILLVYWANKNGWWYGAVESKQGWFPGSYVEPVMELLERVTSPVPINSEDVSQYQQEGNISSSSNNAGSSLSDDITAAFKKREEKRESPMVEETTNQQEGLSFADDILATLNKKKEFENSTLINSTEISETSTKPESVLGGFQNDILSVIGSLGSNETSPVPETNENDSETAIKEERPVTPIVTKPSGKQPTKRPQRKAPPPPPPGAKAPPSVGNQKSESSESNSPISNESPTPDALEKPPTLTESISTSNDTTNNVLPDEKIVETEKTVPNDIKLQTVKKVSTETEVKQEQRRSGAPKVVHTLTTSSPSGKRRRVPPPPPQSLLTSNTKTSEETRNHSPKNSAIPDVPSLDVNDKDELNTIDKPISVNKDAYGKDKPSQLERQHKKEKDGLKTSGGWKPQGKNTNKTSDSAPRRTPPQPPSSSPKNMQPKVKVQKVKRPGRNIPPPPSIPLPPPPTMRTPLSPKSPPPTIPLPPPPVLTVLKEEQDTPPSAGNTSPSSKLESNPTVSTHVNKEDSTVETVTNPHDSIFPEDQVNSTEDTKIEELSKMLDGNNSDIPNIESKSKPQPSPRQQSTHIEKHYSDSQEEKKSDFPVETYQTNVETKVPTLSSLDSDNKTVPPPKKTKPPIKPKPKHISVGSLNQDRDLKPHPPLQSSSSNIKNTQLSQSPQIKKLRGSRPTPPERTSSLPNTPDPSPSPSPSPIPRSTLTNSPLPSSTINRTPSTSPVPHSPPAIPSSAINKTPSTSPIPHSPPPIPSSAINKTPSTSPAPSSVLNPHMPSPPASPNPSSTPLNTENQGSQKKPPPPRPAPPNIVRKTSKEEADKHNKPVSPTKAKVNSLMTSMKKLDGRPQRDSTPDNITSETQESVSKPDSTHPVPARRTKKDMNHPDHKSTKLPTRPPPPRVTTSTTKIEKEDTSLTTQSSESALKQPPIPKPRVLSTQSVSPESTTGSNTFYKAVKDFSAARDEELSFSSGDILIAIDSHPPSVDDGFIYGMLDDGSTGLFPLTHVEQVENP